MSIYVCGDIHGQYGLFQKMLEGIRFGEGDHLFIIGDMIDRGPDGIRILQDVMNRKNVACLIGNHELMMYDYLTETGETGDVWSIWNNGGAVTKKAFYSLASEDQQAIQRYLEKLYLQVELQIGEKRWLLSHSSYLEDQGTVRWQDVSYQDTFNSVWDSPWRPWEYVPPEKYRKDGRQHIIGHVPVQRIYAGMGAGQDVPVFPAAYIDRENNLINIDCGCAAYDKTRKIEGVALCCMNLSEYAEGDPEKAFSYFV